jgi:MFS family permease
MAAWPFKVRKATAARLVALVALATFLNYADRGNLATAAPLLKGEFQLNNTELGILLSAFFWTYIPAQLMSGWLIDRYGAWRILAVGLALWSLATILLGVAGGFALLLLLRLLLGLGESVTFPAEAKLMAQQLPATRLGAANAWVTVGQALGPSAGIFIGGLVMASYGWRAMFLLFGLISLLWLILWTRTQTPKPLVEEGVALPSPSFADIARQRSLWGACLGHFCCNYALYFMFSWLPLYLVENQGLSVTAMARFGGLLYLGYAVSAVVSGWAADQMIASGASVDRVRKTVIVLGNLGLGLCLAAPALGSTAISLAALFASGLMFGMITPVLYAIGQTLAGPTAAGKWAGMQNAVANFAGIIGPITTGWIVDATGSFAWAFISVGVITLAGIIGWAFIIPRIAPVAWPARGNSG